MDETIYVIFKVQYDFALEVGFSILLLFMYCTNEIKFKLFFNNHHNNLIYVQVFAFTTVHLLQTSILPKLFHLQLTASYVHLSVFTSSGFSPF